MVFIAPKQEGAVMTRVSRSLAPDAEWNGVSAERPCAICGARTVCRRHANDAFASCTHKPSDWPLVNGAWLHRVDANGRP